MSKYPLGPEGWQVILWCCRLVAKVSASPLEAFHPFYSTPPPFLKSAMAVISPDWRSTNNAWVAAEGQQSICSTNLDHGPPYGEPLGVVAELLQRLHKPPATGGCPSLTTPGAATGQLLGLGLIKASVCCADGFSELQSTSLEQCSVVPGQGRADGEVSWRLLPP